MYVLLFAVAAATNAVAAPLGCALGTVRMVQFEYNGIQLQLCEDTSLNGSMTFFPVNSPVTADTYPLTLHKHTYPNTVLPRGSERYLNNWTRDDVFNAKTDIMGAFLLADGDEPTLAAVMAAVPPLRTLSRGGRWVSTLESGVDAVFDESGRNGESVMPSPAMIAQHLPGLASSSASMNAEGLIGDAIPTLLMGFPVAEGTRSWEMSAVPVSQGFDLSVMFRFMQAPSPVAAPSAHRTEHHSDIPTHSHPPPPLHMLQVNASAMKNATVRTIYMDTFSYQPSMCGSDVFAGCDGAGDPTLIPCPHSDHMLPPASHDPTLIT